MLSIEEAGMLKQQNRRKIREITIVSYMIGVNLMKPSVCGNVLKIWNVILIVGTMAAFYGQWQLWMRYLHDLPKIVESICLALEAQMSIVKMLYFLWAQHKFYVILKRVCCHEALQKCEIFQAGFPIAQQLKQEVSRIMSRSWLSTRRQLLFYLWSCICIGSNYYVNSFGVNLYHYITQPAGSYNSTFPIPAIYPAWEHKAMTFPYYQLQMFFGFCVIYISSLCSFCFDSFFIVLCMHGVGLLRSLSCMIECSTSELVPASRRIEYMLCCIRQYQRVAAYALEVNQCFRQMILSQFLLSLLAYGMVLFQMSIGLATDKITFLRMVMYLAAAGYQIVIFCFNGQEFSTASEEIPHAFYNCAWYKECYEFRQLIKMMIIRTNRGFKMDISWFTQMSLPTLMVMIKASGQSFLLLQNITQKE